MQKVLGEPLPSRLYDYMETNSVQLQIELLTLITTLVRSSGDEEKANTFAEAGERAIVVLRDSVNSAISSVLESKCASLNTRRVLFERAVNVVEVRLYTHPYAVYSNYSLISIFVNFFIVYGIFPVTRWCVCLHWCVGLSTTFLNQPSKLSAKRQKRNRNRE